MSVKLRLQRKGRTKSPFYHIVVADSRAPRDGRFIEKIGTYNPLTVPATIELNRESAYKWLQNGAQPTDTVRAILRFKGVLYQMHLDGGVKKGALTTEQAAEKLAAWIEAKEGQIAARREQTVEKKRQFTAHVDGKPKVKAKPVVEEAAAPEAEVAEEAVVETPVAAVEAPAAVVEEAPVAEVETPAAVVEEAPVAEAETPAAVVEEAPVAEVETPAAVVEEAPVAEVETPAAVVEEAPVAEVETPAAVVEEAPVAEVEAPAAEEAVAAEEAAPAAEEAPATEEEEKSADA